MSRKGHTFYLPYLQQKYKTPTCMYVSTRVGQRLAIAPRPLMIYCDTNFICTKHSLFEMVLYWSVIFRLDETLASLSVLLCMYVKRKLSETYLIPPSILSRLYWSYWTEFILNLTESVHTLLHFLPALYVIFVAFEPCTECLCVTTLYVLCTRYPSQIYCLFNCEYIWRLTGASKTSVSVIPPLTI
jgi:hypothetical protein